MTAYGIGLFTDIEPHTDIPEYMERIQATLDPYGGRFLVHNAPTRVLEGEQPAPSVVVIEFPDIEQGQSWYDSDDYQRIIPLRTDHMNGHVLLVDGVGPGYDVARTAAAIRASLAEGAGG